MFKKLDDLKLSVSKTFEVNDNHVNVSAYANSKEAGVTVSINHPSVGDFLKWNMISERAKETVNCKVFGIDVSHCELEPKLPPCKDCPLNR